MRKTLLTLLCALALTGCTSTSDMSTATSQPTDSAYPTIDPAASPSATEVVPFDEGDAMPNGPTDGMTNNGLVDGGMSAQPDATNMPESTGVTSMDKVKRVIEQIEDELERLSEVDDAQVIIAGNKAAVALEFDDQYRGGIDDRLRGIVQDRIDSVISGISTVAITADEGIMDTIESLGEKLDTASDMTQLQRDLDAIVKKINATVA